MSITHPYLDNWRRHGILLSNMNGGTPLNRLAKLGGIRDAQGDLDRACDGSPRLRAYLIKPNTGTISIDDIRSWLAERGILPETSDQNDAILWLEENGSLPFYSDKYLPAYEERLCAIDESYYDTLPRTIIEEVDVSTEHINDLPW